MKKRPKPELAPRIRLIRGRQFEFGPGKAELLGGIKKTGSIAEAAKGMGMSYMRAWTLVKNMNGVFSQPLVVAVRGGRQRGGAKLSPAGGKVLTLYGKINSQSIAATRVSRKQLARLLRAE